MQSWMAAFCLTDSNLLLSVIWSNACNRDKSQVLHISTRKNRRIKDFRCYGRQRSRVDCVFHGIQSFDASADLFLTNRNLEALKTHRICEALLPMCSQCALRRNSLTIWLSASPISSSTISKLFTGLPSWLVYPILQSKSGVFDSTNTKSVPPDVVT
jgi:hypothetical protein